MRLGVVKELCKRSSLAPSPLQRHLRQFRLAVHEDAQVDVDQLLEDLPEVKQQAVKDNRNTTVWTKSRMAQGPATHQQEGSQFLSVSGYGVDHGDDVEVRVSLLWTDLYSTDKSKRNQEEA